MVQKMFAGVTLVLLGASLAVSAAAESAETDRRSIHVSGQAQIQVVPDLSLIHI